jgi:hypothetical protein
MFLIGLLIPDKLEKTDLRLNYPTRSYGHLSHLTFLLSHFLPNHVCGITQERMDGFDSGFR